VIIFVFQDVQTEASLEKAWYAFVFHAIQTEASFDDWAWHSIVFHDAQTGASHYDKSCHIVRFLILDMVRPDLHIHDGIIPGASSRFLNEGFYKFHIWAEIPWFLKWEYL
jgi:hypothetical protein